MIIFPVSRAEVGASLSGEGKATVLATALHTALSKLIAGGHGGWSSSLLWLVLQYMLQWKILSTSHANLSLFISHKKLLLWTKIYNKWIEIKKMTDNNKFYITRLLFLEDFTRVNVYSSWKYVSQSGNLLDLSFGICKHSNIILKKNKPVGLSLHPSWQKVSGASPWTGCQSITALTLTDKQPFTLPQTV